MTRETVQAVVELGALSFALTMLRHVARRGKQGK